MKGHAVWKEAVVLRRMGNRGETLKFGIKRVDKGQISCQYKMRVFSIYDLNIGNKNMKTRSFNEEAKTLECYRRQIHKSPFQ